MNQSSHAKAPEIPAIGIRGLTKSYGKVWALRSIDMNVRQGEIFGFLGPNGAGTAPSCCFCTNRPAARTRHDQVPKPKQIEQGALSVSVPAAIL